MKKSGLSGVFYFLAMLLLWSISRTGASEPAESPIGGAAEKSADEISVVDKLVKVVPGLPGDPPVGSSVVAAVKSGLQAYPSSVLEALLQNHYHVTVAPLVVRADPSLVGVHPETYPAGDTFLNCRAVSTTRGICIGAYFYRHGELKPNLAPMQGVQHETAHAIDRLLDRPSLKDPFSAIYREEKEQISLVDRAPLAYYLSAGRVGPIETFAQLLAQKYCHFKEAHTLTLVRCFPRCVQYIDNQFPPK